MQKGIILTYVYGVDWGGDGDAATEPSSAEPGEPDDGQPDDGQPDDGQPDDGQAADSDAPPPAYTNDTLPGTGATGGAVLRDEDARRDYCLALPNSGDNNIACNPPGFNIDHDYQVDVEEFLQGRYGGAAATGAHADTLRRTFKGCDRNNDAFITPDEWPCSSSGVSTEHNTHDCGQYIPKDGRGSMAELRKCRRQQIGMA